MVKINTLIEIGKGNPYQVEKYFENSKSIKFSKISGSLADKVGVLAENLFKAFVKTLFFLWDVSFGFSFVLIHNFYARMCNLLDGQIVVNATSSLSLW